MLEWHSLAIRLGHWVASGQVLHYILERDAHFTYTSHMALVCYLPGLGFVRLPSSVWELILGATKGDLGPSVHWDVGWDTERYLILLEKVPKQNKRLKRKISLHTHRHYMLSWKTFFNYLLPIWCPSESSGASTVKQGRGTSLLSSKLLTSNF